MQRLIKTLAALAAAAVLSACADSAQDVAVGESGSAEQPIVGGTVANPADWPWMVSLRTAEDIHHCGGTLIDDEWVLTAAHCGWPAFVRIGPDPDTAVIRNVENVIPHPDYNSTTKVNDIALVRLSQAVSGITPVSLNRDGGFPSTIGFESATSTATANTRAAGWGRTSASSALSPVLREASLPAVNTLNCAEVFSESTRLVLDTHLCAGFWEGGTSVCGGDSGGPLTYAFGRSVQAGITSWGRPCALPEIPDVYTRVSSYTGWITEHVPDAKTFSPAALIVTVTSVL